MEENTNYSGPDGFYDPAKVMGSDNRFYMGSDIQGYYNDSLTPAMQEYMDKAIDSAVQNATSKRELKLRLRAIQQNMINNRDYNGKVIDENGGAPRGFDISGRVGKGGTTDSALARKLYEQRSKPVNPRPAPVPVQPQPQPVQSKSKPVETSKVPANLKDAFLRLKAAKGTDEDLRAFSGYSDQELYYMGFGPKSVTAIKNATNNGFGAYQDDVKKSMSSGELMDTSKYTDLKPGYWNQRADRITKEKATQGKKAESQSKPEKTGDGQHGYIDPHTGKRFASYAEYIDAEEQMRKQEAAKRAQAKADKAKARAENPAPRQKEWVPARDR